MHETKIYIQERERVDKTSTITPHLVLHVKVSETNYTGSNDKFWVPHTECCFKTFFLQNRQQFPKSFCCVPVFQRMHV